MKYRLGPASRSAHQVVENQGLRLPKHPGDGGVPDLPEDVTELSEKDLMVLYTEMVAWSEYASTQLAIAQVDEKGMSRKVDSLSLRVQMDAREGGMNVSDARLAAKGDPEVVAASDALFEVESYRRLLESVVESTDKSAALLSRELTRRTAGKEYRRRDGAVWGL